jgi:hypothetical protein
MATLNNKFNTTLWASVHGVGIFFLASFGTTYTVDKNAEQRTENPAVTFELILDSNEVSDIPGRNALANLFVDIPERSLHETKIKEYLGQRFKDKYGIGIEEALTSPAAAVTPSYWRGYAPWIASSGVAGLMSLILYVMFRGQQQAAPGRPGRLTADQRAVVDAAGWFQHVGSPARR